MDGTGRRAFADLPLTEQQKLSSLLLVEVYVRRLGQLINEDDFPHMRAALASGSLPDENDLAEDEFLFGLQTVLDGSEALVARRSKGRRSRSTRPHK